MADEGAVLIGEEAKAMGANGPEIEGVLQTLRTLDFVESACLTGSFSCGRADRYSDIDRAVTPRGMAPDAALLAACGALQRAHEVLWLDFAPSLMPRKLVASLFFAGCGNPFRYVDIALAGDGRQTCPPEAFANDPATHLVKLWLINFKHGLRGSEGFEADFARMLHRAGWRSVTARWTTLARCWKGLTGRSMSACWRCSKEYGKNTGTEECCHEEVLRAAVRGAARADGRRGVRRGKLV